MNTEKIKAIRKALINAPLDTINAFIEKYNLGDISLQNLAEYLVNNGDCGLDYDITESLMCSFIDFADSHSLTTKDKIKERVFESDFDFLMDDWNDIWDNLLCSAKYRDNVVYVIEEEWEGPKWDREKTFTLCGNWDRAMIMFENCKEDADTLMHGRCEEWNTEYNTPTHYLIEAGGYNYWCEVIVSKKEIE